MAHLPDGVLSPAVLAGAAALSAAALAAAARRARALGHREAPLHGAATAFIFAAQALTFPLGAGTSAHLFGATLAVVLLGPASAMLVMFAVLLIQALLFQDGGITALGANTLNLAVVAVLVSRAAYRWISALAGTARRRVLIAAGVAAWTSTAAVGAAVALELVLSGLVPAGPALIVVGGGHLVAGMAEAAITIAILAVVARGRPELLAGAVPSRPAARRLAWAAVLASAATIAAAVWLSSSQPELLDAAAVRLGLPGRTP